MATKFTRDHHLLTRNLKLNDKYVSNDGDDEGISINSTGTVSCTSSSSIAGYGLTTTRTHSGTATGSTYGMLAKGLLQGDIADGETLSLYGLRAQTQVGSTSNVGTINHYGIDVLVEGHTSGTETGYGMKLSVTDSDTNYGIECLSADRQLRLKYDGASYLDITVVDDSDTTIATAETGNITIDSGGSINLDAGSGACRLIDDGGTFTPAHAADITTKAYVDTKQKFNTTMSFYNAFTDHDAEWVICNNTSFFKLGGTDISVDDEETASLSAANQSIARSLWFIAPFSIKITYISGNVMDDDLSTHADSNYLGIWVVPSFGTSGNTPTVKSGTQTFALKYITQDWYASGVGVGDDTSYAFYDTSPSLTLSAGDAVWVGHMNTRSTGGDATTIQMSMWGYGA